MTTAPGTSPTTTTVEYKLIYFNFKLQYLPGGKQRWWWPPGALVLPLGAGCVRRGRAGAAWTTRRTSLWALPPSARARPRGVRLCQARARLVASGRARRMRRRRWVGEEDEEALAPGNGEEAQLISNSSVSDRARVDLSFHLILGCLKF